MIHPSDYLKIEENALIVNAERFYASERKSSDLTQALDALMINLKPKTIIVDMEGVNNLNVDNSPILFGTRINESKKKGISIKSTNSNEGVTRTLNQLFSSIVEVTQLSTEDLLSTLKSDPK